MDIKSIFLVLSIIVGLITPAISIRSILRGEYKPQRTTKVLFFILLSISVSSLYIQGDTVGLSLAIIQWIANFIVLLLSFKYGMGGTNKSDLFVFLMTTLTLILWKSTNNPTLGLYLAIITDFMAFAPTLVKAYKLPYTEDPKVFASDSIAGFFNVLALRISDVNLIAFPWYIFLINLVPIVLIFVGRKFKENNY